MPYSIQDKVNMHRRELLAELAESRTAAQRERAREAALALRLMDAGTYGYCITCGFQIPERRLQSRPEATRCTECAKRAGARRLAPTG